MMKGKDFNLFYQLIVTVIITSCTVVQAKQFTFINKKNSTIRLKPAVREKDFAFRMITNGDDGNTVTILNKNKEKLHFQIKQGKTLLLIRNTMNEPITSRVFNHVIKQWNNVRITEIVSGLKVKVNEEATIIQMNSTEWSMENWMDATLGYMSPHESFIGCLEIYTSTGVGSAVKQRHDVVDGCIDACSFQTCQNDGKCVNNYKNVTCDCVGTGYDGTTCEEESPILNIFANNYIKSNEKILPKVIHPYINLIAFRFKTKSLDSDLLQSSITNRIINLKLQNGSLHIECQLVSGIFDGNLGENLDDDRWHSVILRLDEEKLNFKVDILEISAISNNVTSSPSPLSKSSAEVANTAKNVVVIGRSGFKGSLQQIMINQINVIQSIKENRNFFSILGS